MAEERKQKKSNKKKLLLRLLILVIAAGAVFWYLTQPSVPASPDESVVEVPVPDLNLSVLDTETFSLFKVWEVLPIIVGETGKDNPFGTQ